MLWLDTAACCTKQYTHLVPYAFRDIYQKMHEFHIPYAPKCIWPMTKYHVVQYPAAAYFSLSKILTGCQQWGWELVPAPPKCPKMIGCEDRGLKTSVYTIIKSLIPWSAWCNPQMHAFSNSLPFSVQKKWDSCGKYMFWSYPIIRTLY